MELTPGVRYVGRWAVSTVLPTVGLVLFLVRLLPAFAPTVPSLSVGATIALLVVSPLAILATSIVAVDVSQRRRAAAFGARFIPRIRGHLPGNLDVLLSMVRKAETDYIGRCKCNLIIAGTNEGPL